MLLVKLFWHYGPQLINLHKMDDFVSRTKFIIETRCRVHNTKSISFCRQVDKHTVQLSVWIVFDEFYAINNSDVQKSLKAKIIYFILHYYVYNMY